MSTSFVTEFHIISSRKPTGAGGVIALTPEGAHALLRDIDRLPTAAAVYRWLCYDEVAVSAPAARPDTVQDFNRSAMSETDQHVSIREGKTDQLKSIRM